MAGEGLGGGRTAERLLQHREWHHHGQGGCPGTENAGFIVW